MTATAGILEFFDVPTGDVFDVAPEQAVAFFKAKGLRPTFSYADMVGEAHDHAFTVAKMMDVDMLGQVRASLESALANGTPFKQWSDEIIPILQAGGWWGRQEVLDPLTGKTIIAQLGSPARLETIFRTNLQSAYAAGQWSEIQAAKDYAPYLLYDAVDDIRTRPMHRKWDNTLLPVEDKWWKTHYPPNGYNCFPAETPVVGNFTAGLKAMYSGPMVEIQTAGGHLLTVTSNHPVATADGWKRAHEINETDNLFTYGGNIKSGTLRNAYKQQGVFSAEQVFEAIRGQGVPAESAAAKSPLDLYGDARHLEGQINVVRPAGHLWDESKTPAHQLAIESALVGGNATDATLKSCLSALDQLAEITGPAASSIPSGAALPLDGAGDKTHPGPLGTFGLGLTAHNDAGLNERTTDGIAGQAPRNGQSENGLPRGISTDKVVKVRHFNFRGHVYDFETKNTLILAGGVVTSNCRCGVIQLTNDEAESLGLKPNAQAPDDGAYVWQNPRTGDKVKVPVGIDPGFDHNPGVSYLAKMKTLLTEKAAQLPVDMQAAAAESIAKAAAAKDALEKAAGAAQQATAKAAASAALKRAEATIAKKAADITANIQLEGIAAGTVPDPAKWMQQALKKLSKDPNWPNLSPTEKLDAVLTEKEAIKEKTYLSSKLSQYKTAVLAGKKPAPSLLKAVDSLDALEKDKFLSKIDAELQKIAEAKAAAAAAAAAPEVQTKATLDLGTPPNTAKLTQIGPQKGSNPGGLFEDTDTGTKWYIKTPASEDIARNEVLAGKLYQLAGIEVPEMHIVQYNGRPSIASKIIDGLKKGSASELASASGALDAFAVDAWLANWDVVGLGYDNLLLAGTRAVRVDTGGALRYRAQGGLKGAAFGDTVGELKSLRDPSLNPQAESVFSKATTPQIEAGVARILAIPDDQIEAVVRLYGPTDIKTQDELIARLKARRQDLADKYPNAVPTTTPAPIAKARVTDFEQQQVLESRANGFGFKTDGGDIEDQMVMVNTIEAGGGISAVTRGWLKLRPEKAAELLAMVEKNAGAPSNEINIKQAKESVLTLVKGINFRAKKGEAYEPKDFERAIEALTEIRKVMTALSDARGVPGISKAERSLLEATSAELLALESKVTTIQKNINVGQAAQQTAILDLSKIKDAVTFTPAPTQGAQDALTWKVNQLPKAKETTTVKGKAAFNGGEYSVPNSPKVYDTTLPDGTRVRFYPARSDVPYTLQGVVEIDAPSIGKESTEAIFKTLDTLKVKSERATAEEIDELYLNRVARLQFIQRTKDRTGYEAIDSITDVAERIKAKKKFINDKTGIDVEASEGWKTRSGIQEAFGHGRALQLRPDLDTPEFRQFSKEYTVYHNPLGLSGSGNDSTGVLERLLLILENGGQLTSQQDRLRRGIPPRGSSVGSDYNTGGGSYVYTRIRSRNSTKGEGFYFRPEVLKRLDAISYEGDNFGRVTPGHQEMVRVGQNVDSFKDAAGGSANETIFKNSMSLFDQLEEIRFHSKTEYNDAIKKITALGYKTWPDGRKLTEVFSYRGQP